MSVMNTGGVDEYIWNRVVIGGHVMVRLWNEKGRECVFPGWGAKAEVIPPSSLRDFTLLHPGYYFGVSDLAEGSLRIPRVGKYTLRAYYSDAGGGEVAHKLGLPTWTGQAHSNAVSLTVIK
jgi:hypothetical protein